MSFSIRFLCLLCFCSAAFSPRSSAVTWYSVASGNCETGAVWSLSSSGGGVTAASLGGFTSGVDLVIQNGHTIDLFTAGNINVHSLLVEVGGVFFSTNTINRYLNVYGNVICNGTVGGNGVYNSICFNVEGPVCSITGSGSFEAARIRKNYSVHPVSNLTIGMNVNLRWNSGTATQIYNNAMNTEFNVTIDSGFTVNLLSGNISIDGLSGNGFNEMAGTITVNGSLVVSNTVFMQTNNLIAGNSCNIIIGASGLIKTGQVIAGASGAGGHTLAIHDGGRLELAGPGAFSVFSNVNNTINCITGSIVEYSLAGNQVIQTGISYSNLICSGSGLKSLSGNLFVRDDIHINGTSVLIPGVAVVYIGGNWSNWSSAGFNESLSTVVFNGSSTQNISCSGGEVFNNITVNKPAGWLSLFSDVDMTGIFDFTSGIVIASSAFMPRFLPGAVALNVSDISYVEGPVCKSGAADFIFPVGKNGKYRPIAVSALSAPSEFIAEYYIIDPQAVPLNVNAKDPTLDHISRCEYWLLEQLSGSSAYVTLSWSNAVSCGVTSLPDLRVAQWDGTAWTDKGNGGASGTLSSGNIISDSSVSDFGYFTLASSSVYQNPLPVGWLHFSATENSGVVRLHWSTASEVNSDYFEVQRAGDSLGFQEIGFVQSQGNTLTVTKYEYFDNAPLSGFNYYRLRQVDINGSFDYSNIVAVQLNRDDSEFYLFPNPASNLVALSLNDAFLGMRFYLKIYDEHGRVLRRQNLIYQGCFVLDISHLQFGNYFFTLEDEGGKLNFSEPFIKH